MSDIDNKNDKNPSGPKIGKQDVSDEGKTFDQDMDFICIRECVVNKTFHRRGDVLHGRKCPPHFKVKGPAPVKDEVKT